MFRLTECSWIGIVMISMTSSTSITSISGVVLMSIMTSGSPDPAAIPTFIAMTNSFERARQRQPPRGGGSVMKPTFAMPARCAA